MKKSILISIFVCALISCSKEFDYDKFPQQWKLVKMTGQIQGSGTTGADMAWQESILLDTNGTFTKSLERNDQTTVESGTFEFKDLADGKFLVLTYKSINSMVESCTAGLDETIWVRSEKTMQGTWQECDGPGLEYQRIQ